MKKITLYVIIAVMSMVALPNQTNAEKISSGINTNTTEVTESIHADNLIIRLNEINDMDKTNMKRTEKRKLRKEVLAINAELRSMENASANSSNGGGIYLSVGAIIIIVLLLIILL